MRYRENVILLVVFTSIPFLFLTGLSWPQSNIPGFWQGVSTILPSTFGVRGFIRLNMMGATLADIRFEYRALWILTTIYFLVTCAVYRHQIIAAHSHANDRIQVLKDKAHAVRMRKLAAEEANKEKE